MRREEHPLRRVSLAIWRIKRRMEIRKAPVIHDNKKAVRIAAFVSIPKNGSKSVLEILDLGDNRDEETTTSLVIYENHQRAAVLARRYRLDKLFVFCFSRNPYDRCVSWYKYHRDIEPYKSFTFESWIREGMPHHWDWQNQTHYPSTGLSPLLQYNFVEDYRMDFVGRMEDFASDLNVVIEKLNAICADRGLTHRFAYTDKRTNTSDRHRDFERYYTKETKEIVASLLEKDFSHFGYDKE